MRPAGSETQQGVSMREVATVSTQYGDLLGEIALDGNEGPFLNELARKAGAPEGYYPIGLRFYTEQLGSGPGQISLLLVSEDVAKAAGGSLTDYLAQADTIRAFPHEIPVAAADVVPLIKRVCVLVTLRTLHGKKIELERGR